VPAIDISRLQNQTDRLVSLLSDAPNFRRELHEILGFYHRYSHRLSKDAIPKSFMRMYNLSIQVVRQIEIALKKPAQANPEQVFSLVDELWQDDHFEARDLATFLLGQVPVVHADRITATILNWLEQPLDRAVVNSIFTKANATLKVADPKGWSMFVEKLLSSPQQKIRNYALFALWQELDDLPMTKLPAVFNLIRPFLQSSEPYFSDNIQRIVSKLAKLSPNETVYFIKQILADTDGKKIESQARSFLNSFPEENRASLLLAIKTHQGRTL